MALSTIWSKELEWLRLSPIQNLLLSICHKIWSKLDSWNKIPSAEIDLFYRTCCFHGSYWVPIFSLWESVEEDIIQIWNEACRFLCFEYLVGRPGNMIDTIGSLPTPQEANWKELRIDSEWRSYFTVPYTQFIDAVSETELWITIAHNITKAWKSRVLWILIIRNFSQLKGQHFTDSDGWMFDGIDTDWNITFRFDPTPLVYEE